MPYRAPIHKPAGMLSRPEQQREYNQHRGSAYSRGYDHSWRKLRDRFVRQHPLCSRCETAGRIVAATMVDHVIPIAIAPDRRLDETNMNSLCDQCHALKSAEDVARYGALVETDPQWGPRTFDHSGNDRMPPSRAKSGLFRETFFRRPR
jgi:5-methylcytosine-specific restriction enzyme A